MDQPVANLSPCQPDPDTQMKPLSGIPSPDYSQLLDHTLGVVFSCFNNQQADPFKLSSDQLNWATRFIEGHRSEQQSSDLKCLASYLQHISIALTAQESLNSTVKNEATGGSETKNESTATTTTTGSNQICTELLGTMEQWRSEQLTALDRDFETLLAIEKLLLDLDLGDDM